MEKEIFVSGYCRALDQSRMVEVEICSTEVNADCAYPDCPHRAACPIAEEIEKLLQS